MTSNSSAPASEAIAVTPSDTTELGYRALFVGNTGDVAVLPMNSNASVVFENVPSGSMLPIQVRKVLSTGTTATGILGLR